MPYGGQQSERIGVPDQNARQSIGLSSNSKQQSSLQSSSFTKRTGQVVADSNKLKASRSIEKSARDLSNLIDLMPPLSIEQDTKRLILAKKLDRENLDKYMTASGYQSSSMSSQSSSSAALTVHIKCQLKEPKQHQMMDPSNLTVDIKASNITSNSSQSLNQHSMINANDTKKISKKSSYANSILIPIHLIVTDENDNWPVFINSPYIIDLNETIQVGALLPGNEIVAIDNDQQGPLSTIEYSIVAGSLWSDSFGFLNPLDSRSLIVKDNSLLDYEAQSKLTLKVMARDQGEPPNWAITSLYINLADNDDLNPLFSEDKYFGYVKDNQPGEVIDLLPKRLTARDGDKTVNAPIVYSFHTKTNHSIHFDLDPDLGKLSLRKTLLEESSNSGNNNNRQPFCLLVRASQVDNPQRWTLTMINMRMAPASSQLESSTTRLEQLLTLNHDQQAAGVDSSSPSLSSQQQTHQFKFSQSNYTVEVSEAVPSGFTVLNLKASLGQQQFGGYQENVIYYLLDNEAAYFNLDQRSGRLTLNKSLDYELYRHLSVRVLATLEYFDEPNRSKTASSSSQANYPKLLCDITRVNVNVINQNDYKPEFSHEQYNFQLSVSDLIANFEVPQSGQNDESNAKQQPLDFDQNQPSRAGRMLIEEPTKGITKRFGELELEEPNDEPLDWRAMQLGQIYCADRDYSDKVTLQLTGSKSNLFHLTQDGRLYLPLVNLTGSQAAPGATTGGNRRADAHSSFASRTINNQFVQSRLFSSRRSDHHDMSPDRNYLNYLLGEFSNLGRLRLKVLASDNGQPEALQSSALIVITVISIDNFILQRAPQLPRGLDESPALGNAVELNNDTSYDTSRGGRATEPLEQQNRRDNSHNDNRFLQQVMMIPATNGKSFVQINPDIISNLIASHQSVYKQHSSNQSDETGNSTDTNSANSTTTGGQSGGMLPAHYGVQPFGSASAPTSGGPETVSLHSGSKFKPPSLLLVDDDGAKFVAMPVAMEVLNRQVKEAADQQQARQRGQTGASEADQVRRSADGSKAEAGSFWPSFWRFKASKEPPQASQAGWLHWINVSTAILLHLLALAVIVALLSRLRTSLAGHNGSHSLAGHLWPSRLPRMPFMSPKSGGRGAQVSAANSILQQAASGSGFGSGPCLTSSSESSEGGSGYSFLSARHQQRSSKALPEEGALHGQYLSPSDSSQSGASMDSLNSSSPTRSANQRGQVGAAKPVSCGVIVSAMSKGYKLQSGKSNLPIANSGHFTSPQSVEALEMAKHTNLFGHLKLTLNKMLDSNDDKQSHIGHVTVKALDSDLLPFDCQQSGSACDELKSTKLDKVELNCPVRSPETLVEVRSLTSGKLRQVSSETKSSTFVGGSNQRALSPNNQLQEENKQVEEATTIVTISPPKSDQNLSGKRSMASRKLAGKADSSSSSSVVSLVSMSSSIISNKIKAAVERTSSDQTTGSDVSSLDSTTLFNGLPASASRSRRADGPPAPPPPPPPPPSLVQVCADSPTSGSLVYLSGGQVNAQTQLSESKPFSARPIESSTQSVPATRRPLPQNPLHVKLKQQAAAITSAGNASSGGDTSRGGGSLNRAPIGGARDAPARAKRKGSQRAPPTPPPLPSNLLPGSIKTVSPTTSVDRGYESLQSYTSSSQQHQHQLYRLHGAASASGFSGSSDLNSAVSSPARPAGILAPSSESGRSNITRQSPVAGRQAQRPHSQLALPRSSPKQVYKTMIEGTLGAGENQDQAGLVQRTKQRAARSVPVPPPPPPQVSGAPISGRRQRAPLLLDTVQTDTSNGSSQYRASKATGSIGQRERSVQTRSRLQNQQLRHQTTFAQDTLSSSHNKQPADYETEDDDFYYCYSQSSKTKQSNRQADVNNVLSDYASHTYNNQTSSIPTRGRQKELLPNSLQDYHLAKLPNNAGLIGVDHQNGMGELAHSRTVYSTPSSGSNKMHLVATGTTDLMLNPTGAMMYQLAGGIDVVVNEQQLTSNHHEHNYTHHQHQQPSKRHLQNFNTHIQSGAGNKKVLTWSDQVGMA